MSSRFEGAPVEGCGAAFGVRRVLGRAAAVSLRGSANRSRKSDVKVGVVLLDVFDGGFRVRVQGPSL